MPSINGVFYHVEIYGSGVPLVLLHGFTGSSENWLPLAGAVSESYQLIAPDLLGHGITDSPPLPERYRMENVGQDIIGILQQITTEPAHLLGYSMGGRLALYLAAVYPHFFRSLILESASPGLESPEARQERIASDEQLAQRIESEGVEKFVAYWGKNPLFATQKNLPENIRTQLHHQRLKNNPIGLANSLRGMGTGVQPSLWNQLRDIQLHVLLITGELDTKFTQIGKAMGEKLPKGEHVIVPDAGHTIHLEQPDNFARIVLKFLG